MVTGKPAGYSFLPELAACSAGQISIETAQPSLDCSVIRELGNKSIMLGVLDLSTNEVETPEVICSRVRRALPFTTAGRLLLAPDCGLKYLPRNVAFAKMQSMVEAACLMRRQLQQS